MAALALSGCVGGAQTNDTFDAADTTDVAATDDIATADKEGGDELSGELSDSERQSLYASAAAAFEAGRYQYAYGVFMRLAIDGYSDSAERAAAIRSKANATPVEFVNKGVFSQLADVDVLGDGGYLYIDTQGTPQYIYATKNTDDSVKVNTLTPDPSIKGIRSILYSECFYQSDIWVCLLLGDDGKIKMLYDEVGLDARLADKPSENDGKDAQSYADLLAGAQELRGAFSDFILAAKDVVKISYIEEGPSFVLLHSDGSVSGYGIGNTDVSAWKNIVDVYYHTAYDIVALNSEFSYFKTSEARATLQGVFLLPALSSDSDALYEINSTEKGKITILLDGSIVAAGNSIGSMDTVAFIYSKKNLGYETQGGTYIISSDGRVSEVSFGLFKSEAWHTALTEALKQVSVRVK